MKVRVLLLSSLIGLSLLAESAPTAADAIVENYCAATRRQDETVRAASMEVEISGSLPKLQKQGKLHALRHNFAEELSGGQQKLLELARVMMFEPKLILLDEPFAGVNPLLCKLFIEEIEALLEAGTTFVLVSHDLTSIYRLSDHIVVLNQGQKIAEGTVDAIRRDPVVVEAYLGA